MDMYDIINLIILAVGIISTAYSLVIIANVYEKWYMIVPLFVWGLHLSIFYTLIIYARLSDTSINIMFDDPNLFLYWSTIQRLHGVITMLFMTRLLAVEIQYDFFNYSENRKRKNKNCGKGG